MKYIFPIMGYLILLFCSNSLHGQVLINELMAANASTIDDPDFDKKADWIELYNPTDEAILLDSIYLTDNLNKPFQWLVPTGTVILPKGYLLFWADGEDIGNHCNFKLAKSGEAIGLFNTAGVLLDSIIYPAQSNDISYGRNTDGSEAFTFFTQSTPNATNNTLAFNGIVPYQPKFSIKGGEYTSPFDLQLSTLGGTIRYTLDGSTPSENSPIYTSSIRINRTTTLRARAFSSGQIAGTTITHSYFFNENFAQRDLPIISIVTDPDFFWDPAIGVYTQDFKPEWEYPVNVEFFENDGNNQAVFNQRAGIKINGNNSWQFPQKILGLYFKNDYGKKNLDYPIFFDNDRQSFDYLALRASGNDQGSTFFRDALFQEMIKENMGFELQDYRPAAVYVNGEYLGLHNIRSKQNDAYFEDHFNLKRGEYDLISNDGEVDAGDGIAYQTLIDHINKDLSVEANFQALEKIMDIENTVDYLISEIWLSNRSWGHNIKLWKPKAPDAKWRWVIKDVDRGFSGIDNNDIDYFTTDDSPSSYEYARTIVRQLFKNSIFSDRFTARFADHLYTTFHPNYVYPIIESMKTNIAKEIPYHLSVWGGVTADYGDALPSETHWLNEIEDLRTYITERRAYVYQDLAAHFPVDTLATLGVLSLPQEAGQFQLNNLAIPTANWSGQYFQNKPITLKTEANIGYEFQGWTTASYETIITKADEWKYWDSSLTTGTNWQSIGFDDSNWAAGIGQFGYGDEDEQTTLSFGIDEDNKPLSTYFRKSFIIENVADYANQLVLNILKDDGAVIYLNGIEVNRLNMPDGVITDSTTAYHTVEKTQENHYHQLVLDAQLLRTGENVIAVEVHQRSASSSDLSFDLELKAVKLSNRPIFSEEKAVTLTLSSDTILVAQYMRANACILPQTITQTTTLTTACSPYQAIGDLTVIPNVSLIIEAGVEILMPEGANLLVAGALDIKGTAENPVKISPNQLSGTTTWGQLHFTNTTNSSTLRHLIVTGATKGRHPIRDDAAISAYYAQLTLKNVVFKEAGRKLIHAQFSTVHLDSCQLHAKVGGNMVHFKNGTGSINHCDIQGNQQSNTAAIRVEAMTTCTLHQNKIYNFFGKNNQGIEITVSKDILLSNNFINNCTDKGILVEGESFVTIENNILLNCKEGVAVKEQSIAIINENTFYNNEIAIRAFEKEVGTGGGIAQVSNCILSNAAKVPIEMDAASFIAIDYSLSDTEVLPGMTNLLANPHFQNPTQNDFQLLATSTAKDYGRKNGETVDLGAKSFPYNARPDVLITEINYQPIEGEAEFISLFNPSDSIISLADYQVSDAIKFTFPTGVQIAPNEKIRLVKDLAFFADSPYQIFQWTSGKLKDTGETIQLEDANGILIDHVAYSNVAPWATGAAGEGAYLSLISKDVDNHFADNWEAINLSVSTEDINPAFASIRTYPNPVSDELMVDITDLEQSVKGIQVTNQMGQVIQSVALDTPLSRVIRVDLSAAKSGLYYLNLQLADGLVFGKKIIVMR